MARLGKAISGGVRSRAAWAIGVLCMGGFSAHAEFAAGRALPPERDAHVAVVAGAIATVDGSVKETSRALYEVTGRSSLQGRREDYDLGDFGMDGGYPTFGLQVERAWKYWTLDYRLMYLAMDTAAVARRDYYIGVDGVSFRGREYEYMQIPAGRAFTADFTGLMLDVRGLITPCSWHTRDGGLVVTPWISLGGFLAGGTYEIDAGPASGLVTYQNPPETFVVGGAADGLVGAGLPELGLGGELRLGRAGERHLVVRGDYAICRYNGDTDLITTADHRNKEIDFDHVNVRLSGGLEWPLSGGSAISTGVQFQYIRTEAEIVSDADTPAAIRAARERFDKDVAFEMTILAAYLGYRF